MSVLPCLPGGGANQNPSNFATTLWRDLLNFLIAVAKFFDGCEVLVHVAPFPPERTSDGGEQCDGERMPANVLPFKPRARQGACTGGCVLNASRDRGMKA